MLSPRYLSSIPEGGCDSHAHVFGPYEHYPLTSSRTYTPSEVPVDVYLQLLDKLGLARGVLVQPSAYGLDNRGMLQALRAAPERLRGVAVVDGDTSPAMLLKLRESGVRGLRFSRLRDSGGAPLYRNAVDISAIHKLLPGMREASLHAQLWLGLDELTELAPLIRTAGIGFVIDHMGRCNPAFGIKHPAFAQMCDLVREGHLWVKLTPYRLSQMFPEYTDMRPFHEALLAIRPDRLLWGSDWPHVNMEKNIPQASHLLDLLVQWTGDAELLHQILVDNPAVLYGF